MSKNTYRFPDNKFQFVIFDLDGTLIDSKLDIANSVQATLKELNLKEISREAIYSFVGNGVEPLIRKALAESKEENNLKPALKFFRNHYETNLLTNTKPYPGIITGLQSLTEIQKAIYSNKSFRFVKKIIIGLDMDRYFMDYLGGDSCTNKKPDPEGVNYLLKKAGVDPTRTLLIGDSGVDIETGKRAGIRTCGVTYGYRDKKELEIHGADFILDRFEDAISLINGEVP